MARPITQEEKIYAQKLLKRARAAQEQIVDLDQAAVDRAIQAVGWATSNEKTFTRLAQMGVDESGLGDREGGCSAAQRIDSIRLWLRKLLDALPGFEKADKSPPRLWTSEALSARTCSPASGWPRRSLAERCERKRSPMWDQPRKTTRPWLASEPLSRR